MPETRDIVLTDKELDTLAGLEAKATAMTPGPVVVADDREWGGGDVVVRQVAGAAAVVMRQRNVTNQPYEAKVRAEFALYAALRNAAPQLIAAARREGKYRAALEKIAALVPEGIVVYSAASVIARTALTTDGEGSKA